MTHIEYERLKLQQSMDKIIWMGNIHPLCHFFSQFIVSWHPIELSETPKKNLADKI